MKLIKKLTLSITTIACVLSLTACNDDNNTHAIVVIDNVNFFINFIIIPPN